MDRIHACEDCVYRGSLVESTSDETKRCELPLPTRSLYSLRKGLSRLILGKEVADGRHVEPVYLRTSIGAGVSVGERGEHVHPVVVHKVAAVFEVRPGHLVTLRCGVEHLRQQRLVSIDLLDEVRGQGFDST